MHTPDPELQMPQASRRRRRYSDDFKRQVVSTCLEPGVSTAAFALANGRIKPMRPMAALTGCALVGLLGFAALSDHTGRAAGCTTL